MRVCPKCGENFKNRVIKILLGRPFYKLKCDKCNTRLKETEKTIKINSILQVIFLTIIAVFQSEIISALTTFTKNQSISFWGWVVIFTGCSIIINNAKFPWTKY